MMPAYTAAGLMHDGQTGPWGQLTKQYSVSNVGLVFPVEKRGECKKTFISLTREKIREDMKSLLGLH